MWTTHGHVLQFISWHDGIYCQTLIYRDESLLIMQYWIVMAMMLIDCKIMIACIMQKTKRSEGPVHFKWRQCLPRSIGRERGEGFPLEKTFYAHILRFEKGGVCFSLRRCCDYSGPLQICSKCLPSTVYCGMQPDSCYSQFILWQLRNHAGQNTV